MTLSTPLGIYVLGRYELGDIEQVTFACNTFYNILSCRSSINKIMVSVLQHIHTLMSGAQLGIFEGRGSNPRKRTHQEFLKKIRPLNTALQIHK